ncbi:MAG: DUF2283 domain-containing protein [Methanoregula sp.]|nr:DUF2283 domain-containing protein [Methanoregula sp.]MDD5186956.1 DUF2283 domain-containing protein [Methanoregula sp.]
MHDSEVANPDVILDFDEHNNLVGIEILRIRLGHNEKIWWLLINPDEKYPQFEVVLLRSWGYDPACGYLFLSRGDTPPHFR